ncbi:acyl-CoA dehydrogenase family protein [Aerococcus sanguinicola]|uniref:acyl-CoA dehydrogenase family protein n=1 Tax=unclassified Aerococcus TaxID=2618060 RepID=UPI0009F63A4D|nr:MULTISPECIES: acyl-CoA dehydrogenase family protein [unclassified Aerococcus]KAB0647351.1 acyl-CoA dehydrogenase [Aerococcus sanguinicola]MDK6233185.1 acyl-CoA dehydrogenase family protein [Aerococcus sp. UMB10185]MDK6856022.1 acyl-CoA dehydrogenase family protein [Aerococcus sp. UMB7533]MDK8502383.1 acyl-CoA dehydrogenase family protein [Aerococcus sp. UMB1112A]
MLDITNIYQETRKFAKEFIDPISSNLDKECRFAEEVFEELGKKGYFKLIIPKEMGGLGGGIREDVEVVRAIAESNPSVGLCYMMHNVALSYLLKYGNDTIKEKIVKDIVENNVFCALSGTEASSGVHMQNSSFTVDIEGNTATINGSKHMVTSGGFATWYMTIAPEKTGSDHIINWFVSKDTEGVSFEENGWNGVGMRANASVPMHYKDVKVDVSHAVDAAKVETKPLKVDTLYFLLGLTGVYSGLCTSLFEAAKEHAISRTYPDGRTLADVDIVSDHLAKIYCYSASAVSLAHEAVQAYENDSEDAFQKIISSRIVASENAIDSSKYAMRVGGGKAYNRVGQIERMMRDSYAGQVMAPSVDVLKQMLAGTFK